MAARLRYGWIWPVFLILMLVGAGFVWSGGGRLWWGVAMLLVPIIVFVALSLVYYLRQRDAQEPPRP